MKTKLTLAQVRDLSIALSICKELPVCTQFRYAIAKNTPVLRHELEAVAQSLPEPDLAPFRALCQAAETTFQTTCQTFANDPQKIEQAALERDARLAEARTRHGALIDSHRSWQSELAKLLTEEVEIELHHLTLEAIGELNDTATFPEGACLDPSTHRPCPETELTIPAQADTPAKKLYYITAARSACDNARARQNQNLIEALEPIISPPR